eukprot:8825577-Pyramimonas_sp.AAC.1
MNQKSLWTRREGPIGPELTVDPTRARSHYGQEDGPIGPVSAAGQYGPQNVVTMDRDTRHGTGHEKRDMV